MFTFYNYDKNEEWNLCYNERLGKWITRYSWTPIYSENINNIYYSFDKRRTEVLSQIGNLLGDNYGLKCISPEGLYYQIEDVGTLPDITKTFVLSNTALDQTMFLLKINSAETSYLDENDNEVILHMSKEEMDEQSMFHVVEGDNEYHSSKITFRLDSFKDWFSSKVGSKSPIIIPLWIRLNVSVDCFYGKPTDVDYAKSGIERNYAICYMAGPINSNSILNDESSNERKMYDKMFVNGVYVHGRAGIFDEIDYTDEELDNQILPTKWYDHQEPFEFEFIVNDPLGAHKIFENLMIISNNVAPESLQFEIEGDSYSVFKTHEGFNKNLKKVQYKDNTLFKNADIKWDTVLNQYSILLDQKCKSIEKFGRRLGNMHYKEDAWYITIDPLLLNKNGKIVSTKLRDKYLKVRVRYSGKDLAVITAIKTMTNLSSS